MRRLYVMHRPDRRDALAAVLAEAGPEDAVLLLSAAAACPILPGVTTYYAQEDAAVHGRRDSAGEPVNAEAIIRLLMTFDRVLSI